MSGIRLEGSEAEEIRRFTKGEVLFLEGSIADWFYILSSGKVRTFKEKNKELLPISIHGEGDILGEGPLLAVRKRALTAVCTEPVIAFKISVNDVKKVLRSSPDWVGNIMITLADRLNDLYSLVEEHKIVNEVDGQSIELTPEELAYFRKIFDKHKES